MTMTFSLATRVILAAVSGSGVAMVGLLEPELDSPLGFALFYGLSGLFFAAGVLYPCVTQDRFVHLRTTGLVLASAVSFRVAVWMAIEGPFSASGFRIGTAWTNLGGFLSASYAGAVIVLAAVAAMAPLRISVRLLIAFLFAATLGGAVASLTLTEDNFAVYSAGYISWHLLMAAALHLGYCRQQAIHHAIP